MYINTKALGLSGETRSSGGGLRTGQDGGLKIRAYFICYNCTTWQPEIWPPHQPLPCPNCPMPRVFYRITSSTQFNMNMTRLLYVHYTQSIYNGAL